MGKHRLEVADVFRSHGEEYLSSYPTSFEQRRVLRNLTLCRTASLGGHKAKCDLCGHEEISYNSCRDRHCPKCQGKATAEWYEARSKDLLDVEYFHVVFTLPEKIGPLALQNKRCVYSILFRAVSETLLEIARDPKHLGAEIGFLCTLHTWAQNLLHHPHIHCVVPGGGLSPDHRGWVSCPSGFLLPVRVLSRLLRGKFLAFLNKAYRKGELELFGKLKGLTDADQWSRFLSSLKKTEWNVYAKPPFTRPEETLKYLARYTHRVAISNRRLLSLENGKVTFRFKDYRNENRYRTMTLDAVEFIRRFLLHVLPKGFMRIRQYGFLANRVRVKKLGLCRELLGKAKECDTVSSGDSADVKERRAAEKPSDRGTCPACRKGRMVPLEKIPPHRGCLQECPFTIALDTS